MLGGIIIDGSSTKYIGRHHYRWVLAQMSQGPQLFASLILSSHLGIKQDKDGLELISTCSHRVLLSGEVASFLLKRKTLERD